MSGIYIHIPFCKSRCIYCDFYSTTGREDIQDRYVDTLLKERKLRSNFLNDKGIETLYIGGGTPSVLSPQNIMRLSSLVSGEDIKEYTVECNPDDVTPELASTLKQAGVSRVSLGIQTFSDNRLSFINRRHNARQAYDAVETMRMAGIENISIDLMFGFPEETLTEWQDDLNAAVSLGVNHISAYSLMYEEGTPIHRLLTQGKIKELDEELCLSMYDSLIDKLTMAGYEHYEISNFAKPGFRSIHNSNYWNGTEYLGLGAAAHSYNTTTRQWNVNDIMGYITSIEQGTMSIETETIDDDTRYNDMITTALRRCEGVRLDALSDKHRQYLLDNAKSGINAGLLRLRNGNIALTRKGLYVNNEVMSELIWI